MMVLVMPEKLLPTRVESLDNHITKVEFSLLPETREELEVKLRDYVEGTKKCNKRTLAKIVSETLGDKIIEELRTISNSPLGNSTVFVIHNLPEISDEAARLLFKRHKDNASMPFLAERTYHHYFMKGLKEILSLDTLQSPSLVRRHNSKVEAAGINYHNHEIIIKLKFFL